MTRHDPTWTRREKRQPESTAWKQRSRCLLVLGSGFNLSRLLEAKLDGGSGPALDLYIDLYRVANINTEATKIQTVLLCSVAHLSN